MRIGGLASGIDTESIIKNMMRAERIPVDRMKQKQQILEWQRDDYRAINTMLLNFSESLFDMRLTSYYRGRTTSVTNESLVTAVAGNGAGMSSYTIDKVSQLATSSQRISGGEVTNKDGQALDINKSLYSQLAVSENPDENDEEKEFNWKTGVIESQTLNGSSGTDGKTFQLKLGEDATIIDTKNASIKVDGKSYEVVDSNEDLEAGKVLLGEDGKLQFGEAISSKSKIKVDFVANSKTVNRNITDKTKTISLGKGSIVASNVSIKIGDDTYTVNGNNELVSGDKTFGKIDLERGTISVNSEWLEAQWDEEDEDKEPFEIEATFAQNYLSFGISSETSNGRVSENFLIAGNETLENVMSKINQSNVGLTMFYDDFTKKTVMTKKETGEFDFEVKGTFMTDVLNLGHNATKTEGKNAKFTINGLETERSTNTFTMNNVTFTLKQKFDSDQSVQVNVNSDNEKVFDNIVKFVDEYNEVINEIQNKLNEQRYSGYHPLTEEERLELSDRHEEMWDEKARSGLLRRDPMLSRAVSQMRMSVYSPVDNPEMDGMLNSLSQIGITTTANYNDSQLVIDEDKLRKAIEEDPDSIEKIFIGSGDSFGEKGVIRRLSDNVNNTRDRLRQKAGNASSVNHQFSIGREIKNIESQIERFEERLIKIEDRYWKQFSAMEAAVQRANDQMAQLMQAFGGGGF